MTPMKTLRAAAEALVDNIALYPDSAGEDADELVEVKLGDLRMLRRALMATPDADGFSLATYNPAAAVTGE